MPDQRPKIFLTGADKYGWALAEDYNQTKIAIEENHILTDMAHADIVHSVYWEDLKHIPASALEGKKVICSLSGEWDRYEKDFTEEFRKVVTKVDFWVVRSQKAKDFLSCKQIKSFLIPYTVDTQTFHPFDSTSLDDRRKKLKLPADKYLIGNFMRDSSAANLKVPKAVKGPDILCQIAHQLHRKGAPIHVVLAGPRRHWIRSELKRLGVPHTYLGLKLWFDDMRINTVSREKLNTYYNILDISVVSSRSEAGPHAILEAGACKCAQISTNVGIAGDVLPPELIYDDIESAVRLIEEDIHSDTLASSIEAVYDKVLGNHTWHHTKTLYTKLYSEI